MLEFFKKMMIHTSQIPVGWHPPGIKVLEMYVHFHPFSLFVWRPNAPLSYVSSSSLKMSSATTQYVSSEMIILLTIFVEQVNLLCCQKSNRELFKPQDYNRWCHGEGADTYTHISPNVSSTHFIPAKTLTNGSCLPDSIPSWGVLFAYLPRSFCKV